MSCFDYCSFRNLKLILNYQSVWFRNKKCRLSIEELKGAALGKQHAFKRCSLWISVFDLFYWLCLLVPFKKTITLLEVKKLGNEVRINTFVC